MYLTIKARVVADDERERSGSRVTLNLGHTFGHAIEAMGGYGEVTHGEAVALGTLLAARASRVLGLARSPSEGQLELEGRGGGWVWTGALTSKHNPIIPTHFHENRCPRFPKILN